MAKIYTPSAKYEGYEEKKTKKKKMVARRKNRKVKEKMRYAS